jgi:type II secretory pathway component GspD/PulD (secretin)
MERSKTIISTVVGVAAILIIWRVGFQPIPQPTETTEQPQIAAEPSPPGPMGRRTEPNESRVAFDPNAPDRGFAFDRSRRGNRMQRSEEPADIGDPNDPLEVVNMNNVDMRSIIQRLTEWTGRVIIPTDEALRVRVTIYAPERVPRSKALLLVYSALRKKGFGAKHAEDAIYIEPLGDERLDMVPIISADTPLAMIENKDQVVQKFFELKNYSPSQMGQILMPMMGEYGYISADEETGSLLVVDTVKNLMTIALIIEQFDAAEKTVERIFEIRHRNPTEIIELLQAILADNSLTGTIDNSNVRGGARGAMQQLQNRQGRTQRPGATTALNRRGGTGSSVRSGGTATSITVGFGRTQPVLVAETRNNWIIAKATAEDMDLIDQWIAKLDTPVNIVWDPAELATLDKNVVVQKFFYLNYSSPQQMAQVIEPLLTENGHLTAEENTRTLLIIDTVESLLRVEGIIKRFDVPNAEDNAQQIFEVKYGDPSEIVQLIRLLMGEDATATNSRAVIGRTTTGRTTTNRGR